MLDDRARILLKTLIERYIADGQPIGSRHLSKLSGLDLSAATVRNVMADLEDMGFIASPHTSSGRIPTTRGYRLFVDSLLTVGGLEKAQIHEIEDQLQPAHPKKLIATAASLLSQLSHFAGVVVAPARPSPLIRQIEFLRLSERRILLILVTSDGDVQNRILVTQRSYLPGELTQAANYLNEHFAGKQISEIRLHVQQELMQLREDLRSLTAAALAASDEALSEDEQRTVISGERNLLEVEEFSNNMKRLRELFDLLERRTSILQLLDVSDHAAGIQIFIGGESGIASLDECSVITAPYEVNGNIVGSVGVIGPTRMAYERVIPIVDITSRLLSSALSYQDD